MNLKIQFSRKTSLWILTGVCFVLYGATLSHSFLIWDDDVNIFKNTWIQSGQLDLFFTRPYYGLFIPITYLGWALLSFGHFPVEPLPYHLANLLLHLFNSTQVYLFIDFVLRKSKIPSPRISYPAFLGAAFFLGHPLQVETVAWASGLRDLLAASLSLTSIRLFLEKRTSRSNEKALFFFILSLFAKPSFVTLPLALLIFDRYCYPVKNRLSFWKFTPWFFCPGLILLLTQSAQKYAHPPSIPIFQRLLVATDSLGFYLSKFFFPWPLAADYGKTPLQVISHCSFLFDGTAILILLLILFLSRKKFGPLPFVGFCWSVCLFIPVLGFIPFAYQNISTVADHYAYLPLLGFSLILAFFCSHFRGRGYQSILLFFLSILFCISFFRVSVWKNNFTFFTDMTLKNPCSVGGLLNLGNLWAEQKQDQIALEYFLKVKELSPKNPIAAANYALTLNRLKKYPTILREVTPTLPNREEIMSNSENRPYMAALFEAVASAQLHLGKLKESRITLCRAFFVDSSAPDAPLLWEELKTEVRKIDKKGLLPCPANEY